MNYKNFALPIIIVFLLSQCKKESPDTIQCDTTNWVADSICFSNVVNPIIKSHCISCHNDNNKKGKVNLNGYDNVKKYVDNDKLLGTVAHLKGYKKMPDNSAKLSDETVCKVKYWVTNGALNN